MNLVIEHTNTHIKSPNSCFTENESLRKKNLKIKHCEKNTFLINR